MTSGRKPQPSRVKLGDAAVDLPPTDPLALALYWQARYDGLALHREATRDDVRRELVGKGWRPPDKEIAQHHARRILDDEIPDYSPHWDGDTVLCDGRFSEQVLRALLAIKP